MNYTSTWKHGIALLSLLVIYSQGMNNMAYADELSQKTHSSAIKVDEVDLYHATKNRPVKLDLWYKDNACTDKDCQQKSAQKLNIAILSHGAMGAAKDYSWLAYPLAAKGWVVVGVNHFGESWRYGRQSIDPSSVARFWQRTEDVSFVIDSLDAVLPSHLTSANANIVVMGHSSGGHTAAALAGVTMDIKQMYDYCSSNQAMADLGCSYGEKETPKQAGHVGHKFAPGLDSRVTAIIMLDPAMGPASTKASMNSVKVPTLIIGSQNNDFLPFEYHAKSYAHNIPNAKLVALNGGEGHFVYINACENNYKARGVSLCQDRQGVNRAQVHQRMLGHILKFVSNKN